MKTKWYEKTWLMWVLLIFLPPAGILLLWVSHKEMVAKKKVILTVVFIIWFFIVLAVSDRNEINNKNNASNNKETTESVSPTSKPTPGITSEEAMDIAMEQLKERVQDAEPNTSDMVDKIALQARDDAKLIDDKKVQEAISFIRDTYPDYFTDNEIMEKTMYYGYLLDYAFEDSDPYAKLGVDTYQVVKYVYRNVETVEDEATQENLKQIKDSLDEIK